MAFAVDAIHHQAHALAIEAIARLPDGHARAVHHRRLRRGHHQHAVGKTQRGGAETCFGRLA